MLGSNELDPDGWEAPVHNGIAKPILLGGIPREAAILLGSFTTAIGLYVTLWVLPGTLVAWVALAAWTKYDPDGMKILKRFWHQKRYYHG
jgi:type IV secretion system protein VirB3